jgi:hypothetical protein
VQHTSATIIATLDHLAVLQHTLSVADFNTETAIHGWNSPQGSMLMGPIVRAMMDVVKGNHYDWAHCYVVHGIFNIELGLLMDDLHPGVTYNHLHDFASKFTWPRRLSGKSATGLDALSEKRARGSKAKMSFNAQASEALSLYPVIALFVSTVVSAGPNVVSFMALAEVLDLLTNIGRERSTHISPSMLQRAQRQHLDAFLAAYGEQHCLPKHHYALHVPEDYRQCGMILSCLVHERKHKMVKRFIEDHRNTAKHTTGPTGFDAFCLREAICHQLSVVARQDFDMVGLIDPKPASGQLLAFLTEQLGVCEYVTSHNARFAMGASASRRDIVAFELDGIQVGEIHCFVKAADDQDALVLLTPFTVCEDRARYSDWRCADDHGGTLVFLDTIIETLVFSRDGDRVTVLKPLSMR